MYTRPSSVLRAPRAMHELSTPPQATSTSRGRPSASAAAAVRLPMTWVDGTISGKSDAERPLASMNPGWYFQPGEVVDAGARGVGEVGEGLAGQAQVEPVLGPEHQPGLREQGRLVVPVPHHLEHGVALGGEAVAGGQVPHRGIHFCEKRRGLGRGSRVGPDGDAVAQGLARSVHRDHREALARSGEARHVGGVRAARGQQVPGALHHGVPPVRGPLLVPPRVGVERLVGHEGAREARSPGVVERRLRPSGSQVKGENGLRHG